VGDLNEFEAGSTVDEAALVQKGLVSGKRDGIKLLAFGDLKQKLTIKVDAASKSAVEKVEKAGGTLELATGK
jgi:large subunit ribosomal protein L15